MEQNNFEKKIQQKLGELKIPPSDAVWENVEKNISKRKDRKKILIFFMLFVSLIVGGYYILNSMRDNSGSQNQLVRTNVEKDSNQSLPPGSQAKNEDSSFNQTELVREKGSEESNSSEVSSASTKIHYQKIESEKVEIKTTRRPAPAATRTGAVASENKHSEEISTATSNKQIVPGSRQTNNQKNVSDIIGSGKLQEENTDAAANGVENAPGKNMTPTDEVAIQSKEIPITFPADTNKNFSAKTNKSINKMPKSKKQHRWNLGITFSGGTSMVGDGSTTGVNNLNYSSRLDFVSFPSPSNNNYALSSFNNYYRPSPVKSSLAFIAGIFIEKNISRKNKIDLGLSYKYYSLTNTTGNKIDFNIDPSLSAQSLYSSWSNSNTYRNNFHYIEIPVSVKFQLGNSETLPIYWSAGVSVSQLISSNSLQFKPIPGLYYNDNSLYNKTQVGLQTGFSALLFAKTKVPIGIGPYFSYNTSKMANEGLYGGKHFSFIGIRVEILLGKK